MTAKPWQAEWDALRAHDEKLKEGLADPYGKDNYEYDKRMKNDPEHQRLLEAFIKAKRKAREF